MSKIMRKSTMVVPLNETPRGTIWLNDIDLTKRPTFTHTPMVYIYPNPNNNESAPTFSKQFDSNLLQSSLSEVLVPFYPLAGRLMKNGETGRIEINCNAKGVLFVDVETSYNVSDFGEFTPNQMLRNLVIPTCNYEEGLTNMPLLMVQVTRFRCGGVSLGVALHHYAGDGSAYVYFINEWARLARGIGLTTAPIFDRRRILVARNPPQVKFNHIELRPRLSGPDQYSSESQPIVETTVGMFKFSQDQINALKRQAISKSPHKTNYSTYEVLAGHVWRCALKARGVQDDTFVKILTTMNGRSKVSEGIVPKGYFGNFIFALVDISRSHEIVSMPLWYAANKVQEVGRKVNEEYIRSTIDFLSLQHDVMAFATGPHSSRCPDIHFNYWKGKAYYNADFGWGKPAFVRHGGIGYEGQCVIMPNEKGDCLFVAINLYRSHMDHFARIIYDFDDRRAAL